jgi:tetratricopeptide (TPR) repeat protein
MAQEYWVRHQDKLTGPFSGQQLKQMAAAGMILATDMISADEINWRVAGDVKGLFKAGQIEKDSGIDSSASLAATENDPGVTGPVQETNSREKPSANPAKCGIPPRSEPVTDNQKKAAGNPPSPTTVDSISRKAKRTYTCPACSRRFEAVHGGVIGCHGTPRFRIGFFTAAETTECPACHAKVMSPMTAARFCVYALGSGGAVGLAITMVRDSHIYFSILVVAAFFAFVLIRDITMRQRRGLWFLGFAGIAAICIMMCSVAAPQILKEWYVSEETLEQRRQVSESRKRVRERNRTNLGMAKTIASQPAMISIDAALGLPREEYDPNQTSFPLPWDKIKVQPQVGNPKKSETSREAVVYCKAAAVAYEERRYKDAIVACKKAIAIKPDYAKAYGNMGAAYGELGQHTDAITACKKAIDINPDYANAYFNMGNTYLKLGQHAAAIAAYKKAIGLRPDFTGIYLNMGAAYSGLGQYNDEIAAYRKSIALNPNNAAAYCNMGSTYLVLRRYADAIAACKKAIAFKPDYAKAHFNMGAAHLVLKRYDDAIAACKKAIAIKPDYARAYFNLGICYMMLKQNPRAITAYKKAIALEPTGGMADEAREHIRWLRKQ